MDVTLLELTPSALQDGNDYPCLTDEETSVKDVKLGQRSRGEGAESEFTCGFAGFQCQITEETERPSEFPETESLMLWIILVCFLVCRCPQPWELQYSNQLSGHRSVGSVQITASWPQWTADIL